MRSIIVLLAVILLQSCGQVNITGTNVCDGIKKICPVTVSQKEQVQETPLRPVEPKMADQTLLLNRIMSSL